MVAEETVHEKKGVLKRSKPHLREQGKDQDKVYDATNEIKLPVLFPELKNISQSNLPGTTNNIKF